MNILSHLFLSGPSEKLLLGNFIADFVKGQKYKNYEPEIAKGILIHRAIDEFTDKHPIVLESKKRLRKNYRHYAGVLVDIFYDHFLASSWNQYHPEPLPIFAKNAYQIILSNTHLLPVECLPMAQSMARYNWLENYANLTGIERALQGMARRTKFESHMEKAIDDLKIDYTDFKAEFNAFLPLVNQFTQNLRQTHP